MAQITKEINPTQYFDIYQNREGGSEELLRRRVSTLRCLGIDPDQPFECNRKLHSSDIRFALTTTAQAGSK